MSMQIASVEQKYANNEFWVAFPDGERDPSSALGTAFVSYSTSGNTHLAEISITVCPEDLRADMAKLHTRMSTDEPNAGMDYEEVLWDEERIAHADKRLEQQGWDHATTAVRHAPTGELVAYSEVMWQKKKPAAVIQEDTFVLADHRGHRLGAITKAVNLKYLREVNPAARRIYTWNAGENEYMLAINDELGFKVASVEGAWQKRLEK